MHMHITRRYQWQSGTSSQMGQRLQSTLVSRTKQQFDYQPGVTGKRSLNQHAWLNSEA